MIELGRGSLQVSVDEAAGGRLASLVVAGAERLLPRHRTDDAVLGWGAYPMVPYAGRVRRGRFVFGGVEHDLPIRLGPHAIHGTVFDQPWSVGDRSPDAVTLTCPLGPDWPWGGWVEHSIVLDAGSVTCRLTLHALEAPFPGQVGWHPWFADGALPPELTFSARHMYRRDDDYMATADLVEPAAHPWDDCFIDVDEPVRLTYRDGIALALTSDCDHWVVYEPAHAVCAEPQSGPPDGFTLAPLVVAPDRPLTRWFRITAIA